MPVKKCGSGYKYGNSGKCYTGTGARKKAVKQGIAIKISQSKSGKPTK